MDLDKIEEVGLDPLKAMLKKMGGWPVLEGDSWDENKFNWIDTVYTFRRSIVRNCKCHVYNKIYIAAKATPLTT